MDGPVLEYYNDEDKQVLKTECFVSTNSRLVQNSYETRLYDYNVTDGISKKAYAAICPDFLLNQPYYNQIFNSSKFKI